MEWRHKVRVSKSISSSDSLSCTSNPLHQARSPFIVVPSVKLLLNLVQIDMSDLGVLAVKNLGQLFQGRALGFDVEEVDEEELDEDPDLKYT